MAHESFLLLYYWLDSFSISNQQTIYSTRLCAALGGDPAADSPTATLLRLNPTREAQIRTRQKACPHSDLTRMV